MPMQLKEFREALLNQLLNFLWRQWSVLGVLGDSGAQDEWIIDPEPLLVFSLEMARYEPRLFDEILAWLEVNGRWLDTARLRSILQNQDENTVRVVGAALQHTLSQGDERKWRNLARFCASLSKKQPNAGSLEPLFREKSGKPHPLALPNTLDSNFSMFYINRPKVKNLKKSKEVPVDARTNLRFLLRAMFSTGAKSESILYLLTHEGGRPRDIAESVGLFWLGIQQALLDLSRSRLVLAKTKGRKVEYWLFQSKWWEFLSAGSYEDSTRPKWLNWIAIFSALSAAWKSVDEMATGTQSDYMKISRLQDSLEVVAQEFARGGHDISKLPRPGLPPDLHQKMALRFLGGIAGMREETTSV